MKRQIEVRVWDRLTQSFLTSEISGSHPFHFIGGLEVYTIEPSHPDYVFQLFTGLLDTNGKKIFEGDIVEANKPNSGLDGLYEVAWHAKKGRWYYKSSYDRVLYQVGCEGNTTCKVIGNIYETPELLNQ